jgi:hypothetical protein
MHPTEAGTRPPSIFIGDEQIDYAPFDPSVPDEVYVEMLRQSVSQPEQPPSSTSSMSLHNCCTRMLSVHPWHRENHHHAAPQRSMPGRCMCPLRSRLKLKRETSLPERQGGCAHRLKRRRCTISGNQAPQPASTDIPDMARGREHIAASTRRIRDGLALFPQMHNATKGI